MSMALSQLVRASRIRLLLDVSAWTLNRWIREEGLPVIELEGIGRRFDPEKVQAWLEEKQKKTAVPDPKENT